VTEISSAYEPKLVEERWYAEWLAGGEFHAVPDPARRPYVIMMPLPNVTGELHMGHALNNGLQDCLIRWSRMRGLNALWQPGLDHASIAVHVVMDRRLARQGLTRLDLGRERFLEETWKWKEQIGGTILNQLRRLGCACDWDRTTFTMDPGYADAVLECFVRLYRKGLIYKGKRMINWCIKDQTSLSDLEVEYVEMPRTLYYVRYPGADGGEGIVVATQRPETILADVAVAVHPEDDRYRRLVGTRVRVPIVDRAVPVIADRRVERGFGTGAVKITPGHDPLDNEIGADHHLPVLVCLDPQGRINDLGGERYRGHGPGRDPQGDCGRPPRRARHRAGGGLHHQRRPVRAVQDRDRAVHLGPVVLPDAGAGRAGDPGGTRRTGALPPAALDQGVHGLDGADPRLEHQPAALVGAPHPGLVL
jgi:valyl-tRNA synthetase